MDVGCSDGYVAELLPEGWEYEGIELNPAAVAAAKPRAEGRITQGNACTHAYAEHAYDVVLVAETLEHVPDPGELLRRLRPSIRDGGILLATSAMGRGEAVEPVNDEHLREWTLPEFQALHEANGYGVVDACLARVHRNRLANCVMAKPRRPA